MAALWLTRHSGGAACPVCGGRECAPAPTVDHLASYPFLPGGIDPLSTRRHIIAPHRIVDHDLGRVVYGTGQRVPWDDAVKYGLVPADDAVKVAVDGFEEARSVLEQATQRVVDADLELAATRSGKPAPGRTPEPETEPEQPDETEKAAKPAAKGRAKKGPVEDRAKKPGEDR